MDAYGRIDGDPAGTRTQNYSLGGYRDILFHHGVAIFVNFEWAYFKGIRELFSDSVLSR